MGMSTVFDRVWHDEVIYKTAFLKLINLLENRLQKVVLNDQTTSWEPVLASVTHGLVLEPLFFLSYINVYLKIKKIIITLSSLMMVHLFSHCEKCCFYRSIK